MSQPTPPQNRLVRPPLTRVQPADTRQDVTADPARDEVARALKHRTQQLLGETQPDTPLTQDLNLPGNEESAAPPQVADAPHAAPDTRPRFVPVFLGALFLNAAAFASVSSASVGAGWPAAPLSLGLILSPVLAAITAEAARASDFDAPQLRRATLLHVAATAHFTAGASMGDFAATRSPAWLISALLMGTGISLTVQSLRLHLPRRHTPAQD